ncbi:MAG TPA: class I SAM-dependent methyltransferase [Chloroflexota bacterium]|nr:class I SAM-dependent methyltransferase [Chloroflexota bacterium]
MSQSDLPSPEQHKQNLRRDWTEGARAWRKWHPQLTVQGRAATEAIVQAAGARPGMRTLDLASGTGEPALTLASAVAPGGHVTATDLVPDMLAIAEDNAREQSLANISFQQADPEALPFPDQSFDVVTSRFGVMFFPDIVQALREVRRVLKPGGRAAFVAWGPLEKNPFFGSTLGVFLKYVQLPPPPPGAPQPFRFAQAGSLSGSLRQAGFQQVDEEYRTIPWVWPGSVEQLWEAARELAAPAFRHVTEALPPERRQEVEREVLEAISRHADGPQVKFSALIVLASAVR